MKKQPSIIKTLDRLKTDKLAERLIREIERVIPPDAALFHEAVMHAGPPEATQSLRYLPFNRQIHTQGEATTRLSLVALFNNRRMARFHLAGFRERVSRLVFQLASNEMDRFIRAVRLDHRLLRIMADAGGAFSIMGLVRRDETQGRRFFRRHRRFVFPLLLVPTADPASRVYVQEFEKHQTIATVKIPLLPLYRKTRKP